MILGEQVMEELGSGQAHLAAEWLAPGQRLLEVGCSSGYLTRHYRGKTKQLWGLEINLSALRSARRRHPGVPFVCGDVEHLPFADSAFDTAVMLEVIEHTGSDLTAIAEIRRVLKPGGTLILSTPHAGLFAFLDPYNLRKTVQRRFPLLYDAAARLARFESGQFTDNLERHRHYRLEELSSLFGRDFTIRAVHRGGFLLYPLVATSISVSARLWNSPRLLRWLYRLLNWDFRLRFGRLSYNLMIQAEKMR